MRLQFGQKCSSTGAPAPQLRHSSEETDCTGIGSGVIGYWWADLNVALYVTASTPSGERRTQGTPFRRSPADRVAGHAPNELPQPQVCFAFGLWKTNPFVMSDVS